MGLLETAAPNTIRLKDEIVRQAAGAEGPRQQQYRALSATLNDATDWNSLPGNIGAIRQLEANLAGDPNFRGAVRNLAINNPAALNRIIPQILQNPDSMKQVVNSTAASLRPAEAAPTRAPAASPEPVRVVAAAPTVRSQRDSAAPQRPAAGERPPAPVDVAASASASPSAPPASGAPTAAAPAGDILGKVEQLTGIDGYSELMARVEANPRLKDMFGAMLAGGGDDPAAAEATLDGILEQARQNPNIFRDLSRTIDEKPGMVSSIAESMANDPKNGMMMIGMYSQFHQGFGRTLEGFLGAGALDGLIQGLMGMIGKLFGGSGGFMAMGNNGGDLLAQFGRLTGSTAPVTTVDAATGATGEPTRPGTETPAQLAQQREERLRREGQLQQQPGGMSAPAPAGAG